MKLRYKIASGMLVFFFLFFSAVSLSIGYTAGCPSAAEAASGSTMKAVVYRCYGGPEVLEYTDIAMPVPAEHEVLVKVHAAGVNPLDWHYMRGSPFVMRLMTGIGAPKDASMGRDFAGVVEAVGEKVTRYKAGDRVYGGANGAFAEYVARGETGSISLMPDNVSFEEAAAVPVAAITALQALRDSGQLQAGQKVLINGASGGVGTYAVQIAKSMGAEVHGVNSTRNVELVLGLGANHVFDYKKENYTESEERYDLILDMVGNHSLLDNSKVMKPTGRLVQVGGPSGDWVGPFRGAIEALLVGPFMEQEVVSIMAQLNGDDLAILATLMADGEMTSRIDQSFPLADTAQAIAYSETGRARGKIIIGMD
ncbi:MAG: NAD(P)-dependent alcohol dehydrogenase [Halioglobus sp.]